jgi:hypothetical protein
MLIFSMLFFIGISVWAMLISAPENSLTFYDFNSLLLIFPPALFFAIGATSLQTLQQAIVFVLNPKAGSCQQHHPQIRQFFWVLGQSGLLLGCFSTFIGLIAITNSSNTDNFSDSFGPATAVALLTLLYGAALKILCYMAAEKVSFMARPDQD